VFTSDKQSGNYRSFVELDSYAAMDRLAASGKDATGDFGRLMREWSGFGDDDLAAHGARASSKPSSTRRSGIRRSDDANPAVTSRTSR